MAVNKHIYIDCMNYEPVGGLSRDKTAVDGADTTTSVFQAGPWSMEIYNTENNALIIPVRTLDADSCDGWALPVDNTDDNGIEMGFGNIADTDAAHVFTVGTDTAFYFEIQLGIPAVADYDVCAMGFRTATGDYTDNVDSAANLYAAYSGATEHAFGINIDQGDYKVFKTTNGTDAQDDVSVTNAVDDDAPILRVTVSAAGAVAASVDGTAVTLTNAGTAFDTGDIVVPYIILCNDTTTTAAGPPQLAYIACGLQ